MNNRWGKGIGAHVRSNLEGGGTEGGGAHCAVPAEAFLKGSTTSV
jgi:hypothetical protein